MDCRLGFLIVVSSVATESSYLITYQFLAKVSNLGEVLPFWFITAD